MSHPQLSDQLRGLIYDVAAEIWPAINGRLIEAQVLVESRGVVNARSRAGAVGLMQLMPATAAQLGYSEEELLLPRENLCAGIRYLKHLWGRFPEVAIQDRTSFALAAYNAGRSWVNKALKLARADCGVAGRRDPGAWQLWAVAGPYLEHPRCIKPGGSNPDGRAALLYVARIWATLDRLTRPGGGR